MKRLLEDIPSIPQIPSIVPLHLGITTRVMERRMTAEREREKAKKTSVASSENRRRSSKFLEGSAIPNSVLRSELHQPEPAPKDSTTHRKERDEYVQQLMKRLRPPSTMFCSLYNEDGDREALNKIKKELQKRSVLPLTRHHEADKDRKGLSPTSASTHKSKDDPWEELKEKRRIARRTSTLAPLGGERRSTYESIKKAIQNSKAMEQLLNADNIEEQKVKQIQTGTSLVPLVTTENEASSEESSSVVKSSKREGLKSARERKAAKRRQSLKSEKSVNLPGDKFIPKKKAIADVRKRSR